MYPIQLNMSDKTVVIVGGGRIALRKFQTLVTANVGRLIVVSPKIATQFYDLATKTTELRLKMYDVTDIEGAHLIIIATDNPTVNDQVRRDAQPHQWVNHTGDKTQSDFYNMSTFAVDDVWVSVHSNGDDVSRVKRCAQQFDALLNGESKGAER